MNIQPKTNKSNLDWKPLHNNREGILMKQNKKLVTENKKLLTENKKLSIKNKNIIKNNESLAKYTSKIVQDIIKLRNKYKDLIKNEDNQKLMLYGKALMDYLKNQSIPMRTRATLLGDVQSLPDDPLYISTDEAPRILGAEDDGSNKKGGNIIGNTYYRNVYPKNNKKKKRRKGNKNERTKKKKSLRGGASSQGRGEESEEGKRNEIAMELVINLFQEIESGIVNINSINRLLVNVKKHHIDINHYRLNVRVYLEGGSIKESIVTEKSGEWSSSISPIKFLIWCMQESGEIIRDADKIIYLLLTNEANVESELYNDLLKSGIIEDIIENGYNIKHLQIMNNILNYLGMGDRIITDKGKGQREEGAHQILELSKIINNDLIKKISEYLSQNQEL